MSTAKASSGRLRILVTNDDGYDTSGIKELAAALGQFADVFVCAPLHDCSSASSALTLSQAVSVTRREGLVIVTGTPADCVHLALSGRAGLPWQPDLTVAGVNHGGNLGDDTIYSGTVSAAAESALLGVPALAFSLACQPENNFPPTHFAAAAQIAADLVKRLHGKLAAAPGVILNINIPDRPAGEIKGPKVCALGRRHPGRPVEEIGRNDELGLRRYRMGVADTMDSANAGTDFEAIDAGHITVTPLQFDLTERHRMPQAARWLKR